MRQNADRSILSENTMEKRYISQRNKAQRWLEMGFYAVVAVLFFLQNRFCSLGTDDFRYMVMGGMSGGIDGCIMPVKTLKDILVSQAYDYTHINGRFLVHCVTTFFCCFTSMNVFRLVNTAMFVVLIWSMDRLLRHSGYQSVLNKYVLAFCVFFLFPVPGEITLGHIATCVNYLWVACATIGYLILLCRTSGKAYRWFHQVGMFFFACAVGSLQESFSLGLSAALFVYFCFHKEAFRLTNKALVFGYWIGTCILTFAPGNFARMGTVESGGISRFARILINVGYLLTQTKILLLLVVVLVGLYLYKKALVRKVLTDNQVYLLSIMFACGVVGVVFTGERQLTCIEMMSLLVLMSAMHEVGLFARKWSRRLLLCVLGLVALVYYPYIYRGRQKMHAVSMELQHTMAQDGFVACRGGIKVVNASHRNPFLYPFIFDGNDIYGLSILNSGGTNCHAVKGILPADPQELLEGFHRYGENGIWHNKSEEYCVIRMEASKETGNVLCWSNPSVLGKVRNRFLNREDFNLQRIVLNSSNAFHVTDEARYFVLHDTYMGVQKYEFVEE